MRNLPETKINLINLLNKFIMRSEYEHQTHIYHFYFFSLEIQLEK